MHATQCSIPANISTIYFFPFTHLYCFQVIADLPLSEKPHCNVGSRQVPCATYMDARGHLLFSGSAAVRVQKKIQI